MAPSNSPLVEEPPSGSEPSGRTRNLFHHRAGRIRAPRGGIYRQVPADDVLGPIYPAHDLPGAEQRLRDFLIFRFGGPATYLEQRGHPRLRMRHAPFSI